MWSIGFVVLIALVLVLKWLDRSKTFTGFLGEQDVRSHLKGLDQSQYRVVHDLLIPKGKGNGTTQIDHVVVFGGGAAVIETKNWSGRIFGSETDHRWTITLGNRKDRPLNPIVQNNVHIRALRALVGDNVQMHNIVVLGNRADLRLRPISNAFVVRPRELVKTIVALNDGSLTLEQVESIHRRLVEANITDPRVRKQHVESVRRKKSSLNTGRSAGEHSVGGDGVCAASVDFNGDFMPGACRVVSVSGPNS